jgi:hypothetical protein
MGGNKWNVNIVEGKPLVVVDYVLNVNRILQKCVNRYGITTIKNMEN